MITMYFVGMLLFALLGLQALHWDRRRKEIRSERERMTKILFQLRRRR